MYVAGVYLLSGNDRHHLYRHVISRDCRLRKEAAYPATRKDLTFMLVRPRTYENSRYPRQSP